MKVQSIAVAELVNDPSNVRKHSGKNLDAIKGSLARFGQQKPIVVGPDGVVVAGNGTLEAAKALGWKKIDAVKTGLKGSDRTAFAIADNRSSELAEWDDAALAEQLSALAIDDEELLAAAGFDEAELEKLISETTGMEDIVEDEAPEPPADPVTKLGDLWQLGDHRVLCGDSTEREQVAKLLGDSRPDGIFTDPPYGIGYAAIRGGDLIENDKDEDSALKVTRLALAETCATVGFVCCDWRSLSTMVRAMNEAGLTPKACIVWDKERGVQNLDRYFKQHELVLYFGPYGGQKTQCGDVWRIARDFKPDHPTPKPVELVAKALRTAGIRLAYDPFLGSGTTLIAAEQLGRKCYGIEISPAYCDVIVERWQNLTGKKAKRIADGKAA